MTFQMEMDFCCEPFPSYGLHRKEKKKGGGGGGGGGQTLKVNGYYDVGMWHVEETSLNGTVSLQNIFWSRLLHTLAVVLLVTDYKCHLHRNPAQRW